MNKITASAARELVRDRLDALALEIGFELDILDSKTVEGPEGWIFFFNSTRFISTGDGLWALAGNGPIVVKNTGSFEELSSADGLDVAYEKVGLSK